MVPSKPESYPFPIVTLNLNPRNIDWEAGALIPVDKPGGWTSFDVVGKMRNVLRRITGNKKIKLGHSGTLDPMATGLLLIATGKATKSLHQLIGLDKQYTGTFLLGADTPSYDAETPVSNTYPTRDITPGDVEQAVEQLRGEQMQLPPPYSAIKQKGKPVYLQARQGKTVILEPRKVFVYRFDTDTSQLPQVAFSVHCSKGTYIRSMAHDLGRLLQNGAYLTSLRRTAIGSYALEDAWALEEWLKVMTATMDE